MTLVLGGRPLEGVDERPGLALVGPVLWLEPVTRAPVRDRGIATVTWGLPHTAEQHGNDARVARQIAEALEVPHRLFPIEPRGDSFDAVLSSEAVEHTPDPRASVRELYRLVKPGGSLVISMPNRLWQAPVRAASAIGLRPYDGYENFLWPRELRQVLERAGAEIIDHRGIHLWPFQIVSLRPLSQWVDRFGDRLLTVMINQCLHCRKPMYNPHVSRAARQ